jgi:hypothetical protein
MLNDAESLKLLKSTNQIDENFKKLEDNLKNKSDNDRSPIELNFVPDDLLDNYEIGDVIGEGFYAKVRECKDLNTGILFALKIIDLRNFAKKVSYLFFLYYKIILTVCDSSNMGDIDF